MSKILKLQETQSIQGSTQTHSSQEFGLNFRHVLRQSAPAAAAAAPGRRGLRGPRRREPLRPLRGALGSPDAEDGGQGPGLGVVLGTIAAVRGHGGVDRIQEDTMEDTGSMGRCGLLRCFDVFWCVLMYVWICHILHMVVWKDWKLCNIYLWASKTSRTSCHAFYECPNFASWCPGIRAKHGRNVKPLSPQVKSETSLAVKSSALNFSMWNDSPAWGTLEDHCLANNTARHWCKEALESLEAGNPLIETYWN